VKVSVVTLFPAMLQSITDYGVTGKAVQRGLLEITAINPRDFAQDKQGTVDDRPYGGGPGMLMKVQPLQAAITATKVDLPTAKVIYLSPQGRKLDQTGVLELAQRHSLILVAGRYAGIDERLLTHDIDEEWSLGDFVLSGGELAAMCFIDAMARIIPGVLGHAESAKQDSFAQGLLDCPHYTRPETVNNMTVPSVLLHGNHQAIARWRRQQQLGRTWQRRPDLLEKILLTKEQQRSLIAFIRTSLPPSVKKQE
jgi:tRNA (guanine37-N1)-methyltransferase